MEILFKAKIKDTGEWVQGYYAKREGIDSAYIIQDIYEQVTNGSRYLRSDFKSESFEVDPETVCRYIGLTDREKKQIFENDIIEIDKDSLLFCEKGIVKFGNGTFDSGIYNYTGFYYDCYDKTECDEENDGNCLYQEFCSRFVKVIGNIFDKGNEK